MELEVIAAFKIITGVFLDVTAYRPVRYVTTFRTDIQHRFSGLRVRFLGFAARNCAFKE